MNFHVSAKAETKGLTQEAILTALEATDTDERHKIQAKNLVCQLLGLSYDREDQSVYCSVSGSYTGNEKGAEEISLTVLVAHQNKV